MSLLFQIEDVSFSYHGIVTALDGANLSVAEGDILAIIGANGSGKSTLLQIMAGLLHPESGSVRFRGEAITEKRLSERDFRRFFRSRVGIVFQNADVQLFCATVTDEILFGPLQLDCGRDEAGRRAQKAMEMLGIRRLADRPTHMLSGGEKKRVALASVLAMEPEVILLDEPMSGLDPKTELFLTDLILSLHGSGVTIVIATHDLELVDHLQPRVAVLSEDHRVVRTGGVKDILTDPDLLVRVNLIHEHRHRHGNRVHSHLHTHYLFHDHSHETEKGELDTKRKKSRHSSKRESKS